MKYQLTSTFSDSPGHSIVETWSGLNEIELSRKLIECLDVCHTNDQPSRPDLETLKKNLGKYADDEFINCEFNRLNDGYNAYNAIMDIVKRGISRNISYQMNTTNTVICVNVE